LSTGDVSRVGKTRFHISHLGCEAQIVKEVLKSPAGRANVRASPDVRILPHVVRQATRPTGGRGTFPGRRSQTHCMAPGSSCSSSCSPKPASVEAAAGADCGGPAGVVAQVDSPPATREVRHRSGLPGPAFNRSLGRAASGGNMPFSWTDPFPTVNSPNDPS
jgi:hypothetical protein